MQISFTLNRQVIARTDQNSVAAGSRNYLTARFALLSDDWQPPITAIFGDYKVILDENGDCMVPWEAIEQPGEVAVSAFCGDLHTATAAVLRINPSGYTDAVAPEPPTPDVYAQLAAMTQTAIDTAEGVRADADSGAFDGSDGFSPVIETQKIDGGHRIIITDAQGTDSFDVLDGYGSGVAGGYYTPSVANGVLTWAASQPDMDAAPSANIKGDKGDKGDTGAKGDKGEKGDKGDTGLTGEKGEPGQNGAPGKDGGYYTPSVTAGGVLTWNASRQGMPSVSAANIQGPPGADGAPGESGVYYGSGEPPANAMVQVDPDGEGALYDPVPKTADMTNPVGVDSQGRLFAGGGTGGGSAGADGFSPTVTVSAISGGNRIVITDKDGPKTIDVMDGEQGPQGEPYALTDADKTEIKNSVIADLPAMPATQEEWTFELESGETVTKKVALYA